MTVSFSGSGLEVVDRCLSDGERRIGGLFYKSDPATPWLIVQVQNNVL